MNNFAICVTILGVVLTITPIVLEIRLRRKKKNSYNEDNKAAFRAFFLTREVAKNKGLNDYYGIKSRIECNPEYLMTLLNFLLSAKKSVDFCINHFTLHEYVVGLSRLRKKGIKVRVIMDKEMSKPIYRSAYANLKIEGIDVKVQPGHHGIMHHKFLLIDADHPSAKVMFGSVNFTHQAMTRNFETMLQTNCKDIVKRFNVTFEEMWNAFEYPKI